MDVWLCGREGYVVAVCDGEGERVKVLRGESWSGGIVVGRRGEGGGWGDQGRKNCMVWEVDGEESCLLGERERAGGV